MGAIFVCIGTVALVTLLIFSDNTVAALAFLATALIAFGLISLYYESNPSAIDVYRGKTELKITGIYKDSIFIPTDSTVIFKTVK